ncbi:MAG: class I SAM-dependent methyltransferase [Desulfobulbaceae bacterium]|nr:class I SAM-dependent methyltransferase [Pseudomonadota bacterium]MCG2746585.1 class I SAM-dependent methyltransferase [Desulfobulbaceae bacterium]
MTSELFDKAAADWDKNSLRLQLSKSVAAAIKNTVPLNKDMCALEIGCGTGLITTELAPHLKNILATDTSGGMLWVLQEKINGQSLANIETVQLDLAADDDLLVGRSFDLIYSSMTLHHIKDTAAVLQKCRQLLAPEGFLVIADLEKEDGTFHGDMDGVEHLGFAPGQLAELVSKCGFAQLNTKRVHVITKENAQRQVREYPVFLLTARKGAL